jgi:CRP-like cAMP-binding protein
MPADPQEREAQLARYHRRFDAGARLFREGDAPDQAFLLVEGRVRLLKQVGALERSLRVARPGEVVGESALLTGSARGSTAIALDAVVALAFDMTAFKTIVGFAPDVAAQVVEQLARRLRDAEDQIELLMIRDAQSKIVVALLKLAEHEVGAEARPLALQVTPLELSAQVGLDVDSVKRIVLGLREAGYVRVTDERVEVPDLAALRELHGLLGVKDQLRGGSREGARNRALGR